MWSSIASFLVVIDLCSLTLASSQFYGYNSPSYGYGSPKYPGRPGKSGRFPDLMEVDIDTLRFGLAKGLYTSQDLTRTYIARIEEANITLHAVTEINPDALAIAAQLDSERKSGRVRGSLHGIPILIKNNIATKDKMNNTAGSFVLLGAKVPRDSAIAQKLRAAGAIILGKTNLSQWANFRSDNSSNGWSAYGGQTYAAYYPNQDPSGSSSGSGVSADLGLALAAIGTETDGSIISPSSNNNLAAIKPTVGLTSRNLVIPISEHQDTVGPMARSVKDAAYILQAIAGYDKYDNYTSAIPNRGKLPDYVAACRRNGLRGARIGIPRNYIDFFATGIPIETAAFFNTIGTLKAAGAQIVTANFTALEQWANSSAETEVLNADFIVNLNSYLKELTFNPRKVTTLSQVRSFTRSFPAEDYPDRDTGVWDDALDVQKYNNTDPRFWKAYQEDLFLGGEGGVLGAIKRHKLDAIITPSSISSSFPAIVGSPIVTVPLGFYPVNTTVITSKRGLVQQSPNFPFGLSFLGTKWSEAKLISLAYAYEQRTKTRNKVKPYFIPNIGLKDIVGT